VVLYRPNFDEEAGADYTSQTRPVWQTIFGGEIEVRREVIAPALSRRFAQYEADAGNSALKDRLRRIGRE